MQVNVFHDVLLLIFILTINSTEIKSQIRKYSAYEQAVSVEEKSMTHDLVLDSYILLQTFHYYYYPYNLQMNLATFNNNEAGPSYVYNFTISYGNFNGDFIVNNQICNEHCALKVFESQRISIFFDQIEGPSFSTTNNKTEIYFNDCVQTLNNDCLTDEVSNCICGDVTSFIPIACDITPLTISTCNYPQATFRPPISTISNSNLYRPVTYFHPSFSLFIKVFINPIFDDIGVENNYQFEVNRGTFQGNVFIQDKICNDYCSFQLRDYEEIYTSFGNYKGPSFHSIFGKTYTTFNGCTLQIEDCVISLFGTDCFCGYNILPSKIYGLCTNSPVEFNNCNDSIPTSSPVTSTSTMVPFENVFEIFFFDGNEVRVTVEFSYGDLFEYFFEFVQHDDNSSLTIGTNLCDSRCTIYATTAEFVNATFENQTETIEIALVSSEPSPSGFATYLYIEGCLQSIQTGCISQSDPFFCVCENRSDQLYQYCNQEIIQTCSTPTVPYNDIHLMSFEVFHGNSAVSGLTMDVFYYADYYQYNIYVLFGTKAAVYVDSELCSVSCSKEIKENEIMNIQFYDDLENILSWRGIEKDVIFSLNGCGQNLNNCSTDDKNCVCKIDSLANKSNNIPTCNQSPSFLNCTSTSIFLSTSETTPSTTELSSSSTTYSTQSLLSTTSIGTTELLSTSTFSSTSAYESTSVEYSTSLTTLFISSTYTTDFSTTHTETTSHRPTPSTSVSTTHQSSTITTANWTPTFSPPVLPSLKNLSDSSVSLNNVTYVLNTTIVYSSNSSNLQPDDISDISIILSKSSNLSGLPTEDANLVLVNVDNVLNAEEEAIIQSEAQDTFLSVLSQLAANVNSSQLNYLSGQNLGYLVNQLKMSAEDGLVDRGTSFQALTTSNLPSNKLNAIVLKTGENGPPDGSYAFFTIFRTKKFFSGATNYRNYPSYTNNFMVTSNTDELENTTDDLYASKCQQQLQVPNNSPVLSATVVHANGNMISNLQSYNMTASLHLNTTHLLRPLHGRMIVSWWNVDENKWSQEDLCSTIYNGSLITASCPHLTDFALIIDGTVNDPTVCDDGLIDISFATNGLSVACLFIILFIQFSDGIPFFKHQQFLLRVRGPNLQKRDFVQIFNNIALFFFYFLFLIFSNQSVSGVACDFIAALMYSLLIGSIILTISQALRTIHLFVPSTFKNCIDIFLRPLSVITISFVFPFVISIILAATTPFFHRQDGFCWVRPDLIVYAILVPVTILLVNAFICTMLVAWRLFAAGLRFKKMGKVYDTQLKTKLFAIFMLQFTMGMPWILQYPTLYSPYATPWHYIFTIVLGSQGTIMAVLFFYKSNRRWRESVRESQRNSHKSNNETV